MESSNFNAFRHDLSDHMLHLPNVALIDLHKQPPHSAAIAPLYQRLLAFMCEQTWILGEVLPKSPPLPTPNLYVIDTLCKKWLHQQTGKCTQLSQAVRRKAASTIRSSYCEAKKAQVTERLKGVNSLWGQEEKIYQQGCVELQHTKQVKNIKLCCTCMVTNVWFVILFHKHLWCKTRRGQESASYWTT